MKRAVCLLLVLLLAVSVLFVPAGAAPGDESDPVVSLSYLNSIYRPALLDQLHADAERSLTAVYNANFLSLAEAVGAVNRQQKVSDAGARRTDGTLLVKSGDVLTLLPGTKVMPLSGTITSNSEHLINVSAGVRVASGAKLAAKTLYMKDDSASGGLTVTSETAALVVIGPYTLAYSSATDFASRADALNELGLFLGYSTGYELEITATRVHGLVVFIRIMGLEDEALAYTGSHPFTDVPPSHWAYRYVAYAYHLGVTNGTTATTFSPNTPISAKNYIAFMMRALHYEEGTQFNYSTILTDCVSLGLYTRAEVSRLTSGAFTRGRMVYLSYYSLFCTDQQNGQMLLANLISDGTVTQAAADRAVCRVVGTRIT